METFIGSFGEVYHCSLASLIKFETAKRLAIYCDCVVLTEAQSYKNTTCQLGECRIRRSQILSLSHHQLGATLDQSSRSLQPDARREILKARLTAGAIKTDLVPYLSTTPNPPFVVMIVNLSECVVFQKHFLPDGTQYLCSSLDGWRNGKSNVDLEV